jgi:thiamine-monophosphate kinase
MQKRKMDEFNIIKEFFTQPSQRDDVALGSGDDCALVNVPSGQQVAVTTDTLVSGVHFPAETSPFDIGFKAMAVNLSDIAAMGATPAWVTGALTLPAVDKAWLAEFARGFFAVADKYNVQVIGGDLTHGPLTITVQAMGLVPTGKALTRSGASAGDLIYVTNTVGDAGLALQFLTKKISVSPKWQPEILTRLNQPEPRVPFGESLRDIASAAIDISDGLAADLRHILNKSGVGARVFVDKLPLSSALSNSVSAEVAIKLALTAGDDYELCFTVPGEKISLLADMNCTCIGEITSDTQMIFQFTDGSSYDGDTTGYQHF